MEQADMARGFKNPNNFTPGSRGICWPEQFVVRGSGRGLSDVKKEKVHTKGKSGIKAALFFRIHQMTCQ